MAHIRQIDLNNAKALIRSMAKVVTSPPADGVEYFQRMSDTAKLLEPFLPGGESETFIEEEAHAEIQT